ncbi:MAG: PilN domain-containing protein [Pseudomonadota bacterium]|nr:PilN domain-containing protein [Pseudomonadota bacterium]
MRGVARRTGVSEFWRWWTGELRALVPRPLRNALQRWRARAVVVFRPDEVEIWRLTTAAGALAYTEPMRVSLRDDANQVAIAARAAIDAIAGKRRRRGTSGTQVMIALTPQQVLRKRLTYPAAVESNLAHVLSYDLDRHTPFKSDELYYAASVVSRDAAHGEIRVELVAALKSVVDQLRRQVGAWGGEVVAIVPDLPALEGAPLSADTLDVLPEEERVARGLRPWQVAVPVVVALAVAGVAIAMPLLSKREEAIALLHATEQARVQAAGADALRQQLDHAVEDYNFVLARKYMYPSTYALLDDVTRLLPDDTWLTTLELKSIPKGKEAPRKEILLRGESGNAGRLVTLLEDSQLFEQASPRSPTTKIQPGPGEIFDLGAQLKPLSMPQPVPIAISDPGVAAAGPVIVNPGSGAPPGAANAAAGAPAPATSQIPATAARGGTTAPAAGGSAPAAAGSAPASPAAPRPVLGSTSAPGRPAAAPTYVPTPAPATFGPVAPDGRTPGASQ